MAESYSNRDDKQHRMISIVHSRRFACPEGVTGDWPSGNPDTIGGWIGISKKATDNLLQYRGGRGVLGRTLV
jgi:hypothetical protein